MNKLIWEELTKELPKLSQLPDPIKYINTTIVPILFDCFQLKSLAFMKVLSIRFYQIIENPHWFFKDWVVELQMAGMRHLLAVYMILAGY